MTTINHPEGVLSIDIKHQIKFNTKNAVPVADLIKSLAALDNIINTMPIALGKIIAADVDGIELYFEKLESGSIVEDIIISVFFKDKENYEKAQKWIGENVNTRNLLIGAVIGGFVTWGVMLANSANKTPAASITANNNTIINIGAGEANLTPEGLKSIIETSVRDKKALAQNSVNFLSPAKGDSDATVSLDESNTVNINKASIAETPLKYEPPKQTKNENLENVNIIIRALDYDSKKTGWAGKIENKTERLKIELDPDVSDDEIKGKNSFHADVTLIYKLDPQSNQMIANKIFIRKIY
ncbi:MAG: hypothetical protein LWW74_06800 [Burkholderiales bacterium]|nr:hypothetical protein [Burkholderiales bacterium]